MRWDFAISCMEPIDHVTGGIGTYTRLLLSSLSKSAPDGFRIIAFLGYRPNEDVVNLIPNVRIEIVSPQYPLHDCDVNNAGNEHDLYSLHLAKILNNFTEQGHSFGVFEFPDYGSEAYCPIKLRRAGLIHVDTLCLRLHSPEIMLAGDNLAPPHAITDARVTRFSREIYCYRHADQILFGADAMLERIERECLRYGISIKNKSTKIPHPYPSAIAIMPKPHDIEMNSLGKLSGRNRNIGLIGRLETRKGFVNFVKSICENSSLRLLVSSTSIYFHFFGADTYDFNECSNADSIRRIAKIAGLEDHFIIHGKILQSSLGERIAEMDGLIFPSIFENYANALLETLPHGIPTLVSSRGALGEISSWARFVRRYDPLSDDAPQDLEEFLRYLPPIDGNFRDYYATNINLINNNMLSKYFGLCLIARAPSMRPSPDASSGSVSFIIPHFCNSAYLDECISSIREVISNGRDEIIVVDDGSPADEASKAREICKRLGAQFIALSENNGPAAARNAGVAASTGIYIQFLDADDRIDPDGFRACMSFILANPEVDMVYGIAKCFGAQWHAWVPTDSHPMAVVKNFSHSAILIKSTTYRKIGGQPEFLRHHYEDWGFNVRFMAGGYYSEMIPLVSFYYRINNNSRSSLNNDKEKISRSDVLKCLLLERPPTSASIAPYLDCIAMISGSSTFSAEHNIMVSKITRILMRSKYRVLKFRHIPFIYMPIYWMYRIISVIFRRI